MSKMTEAGARLTIEQALATWPAADLGRLAYLITLGPASALANAPTVVPVERGVDPGGVPTARRDGGVVEQARADLLHVYRATARLAGHPMAPPGSVTT